MKNLIISCLFFISTISFASVFDHSAGVFLGAKTASKKTHFAMGVDYEYHMGFIGLIGFAERVLSTPAETSIGTGIALHPIPLLGLKLFAGPGLEFLNGTSSFLLRVGAAYESHIGPLFLGPQFAADTVHGKTGFVYGLIAGVGF